LTPEMQTALIERQRQRIEQQDREIEELRKEFQRRMKEKDNQCKRAWAEADRLKSVPPRVEIRDRYTDKCNACKLDEYRQARQAARRYIRFLTAMLIVGIICEIVQSRVFLWDLADFIKVIMLGVLAVSAGPVVSGHYLAKAIGWVNGSGDLTFSGQILRVVLPVLIYAGYFLFSRLAMPKVIIYFRESSRKRRIPRIIGFHVFCVGTIISLCCARLIPEHDGFRINSMLIPVTAYGLWLGVSRYYEGGWWFKGWDAWMKDGW